MEQLAQIGAQIGALLQAHPLALAAATYLLGVASANVAAIVKVVVVWLAPLIRKNPKLADAIVDALRTDVHQIADAPAAAATGAQAIVPAPQEKAN